MRNVLLTVAVLSALGVTAVPARADFIVHWWERWLPRPRPTGAFLSNPYKDPDQPPPAQVESVPLVIQARPNAGTRLVIPGKVLDRKVGTALPVDETPPPPRWSGPRVIVAGIALSAALALGGLWLARSRGRRALFLGLRGVLAVGVVIGVSCTPFSRSIREDYEKPIACGPDGWLSGTAWVDVQEEVPGATLTIDRDALVRLAQQNGVKK